MRHKRLGNTNEKVVVIGQGCMGIDQDHINCLKMGIELGMNFIDTAEGYGGGYSEEIVARAIEGIRDKVFIATKVSPENLSYKDLLESAEGSLRRLKTDYIDLYQVHWPNPKIPNIETMRAMGKLLKDGKIRHVGVCNFSLKELNEAEVAFYDGQIVSIQVEYNLFDRTIENTVLPYCESKGMTTISYSPLDQGRICSSDEKMKTLQRIAKKYNKTMAQIALNWLITHPSVIAIPKATNPIHIKENASSSDFKLLDEDFSEINKIFTQECMYVPVDRIRVIAGGQGNRQVYQTIEEAIENKFGFIPSPLDLAQNIKGGEVLKPVRVVQSTDRTGRYDYDLVEGRLRYWAWVIAHNRKEPIPAYIRND